MLFIGTIILGHENDIKIHVVLILDKIKPLDKMFGQWDGQQRTTLPDFSPKICQKEISMYIGSIIILWNILI